MIRSVPSSPALSERRRNSFSPLLPSHSTFSPEQIQRELPRPKDAAAFLVGKRMSWWIIVVVILGVVMVFVFESNGSLEEDLSIESERYDMTKATEKDYEGFLASSVAASAIAETNPEVPLLPQLTAMPLETTKLPECKRTLLFRFANLHGLASEFNLLLRLSALATAHSYTLIIDSSSWNYGPFESYFLPPTLSCTPPSESKTTRKPLKFRNPTWYKPKHLIFVRDVDGLDAEFVRTFIKAKPKADGKELVPLGFGEAFQIMEEEARKLWRVNEEVETEVAKLAEGIERDKARGAAVLGMHVRLGDKYLELDKIGPQSDSRSHRLAGPGLHSETIKSYSTSAKTILSALPASLSESNTSENGKPTLVIMSDKPGAWKSFAEHACLDLFRVLGTEDEAQAKRDVEGGDLRRKIMLKRAEDPLSKTGGFHETAFNRLPIATRIAITKSFIRDVTYLSRSADGLVMSGSSNVGRLMTLLAGMERVQEGRVSSVDTRWFPTARYL